MVRMSLVTLLSLVPALAAAQSSVSISAPSTGAFVDASRAEARGWANGVYPRHEVRVNGVLADFTPIIDSDLDGIADSGPWSIPLDEIPAGLDQIRSAQHSVRAEIIDTTPAPSTWLLSSAQVAFYDVSEFGAVSRSERTAIAGGVEARVTDGGLADVAEVITLELEAIRETEVKPLLAEIAGPGDEIDVELPVAVCAGLDWFGLDVDMLSVSGMDFGITNRQLRRIPTSYLQLCVESVRGDLFAETEDLITGAPDLDGDGESDPFLVLDAVTDGVNASVTTGSFTAGASLGATVSLSISGAVAAFPGLTPSVEVVEFEMGCGGALTLPSTYAEITLDLQGSGTPQISVDQTGVAELDFGDIEAELTGVCAPLSDVVDAVVDAATPHLEERIECLLTEPECAGPKITRLMEDALSNVRFDESVAVGEYASVSVSGLIGDVIEDETGVTVTFDTKVEPGEPGLHAKLVPERESFYRPAPLGNWFEDGDHYDLGLFAESAQLTQALHAAWRTGALHTELSTTGELGVLDIVSGLPADTPLDAAVLTTVIDGLADHIPLDTPLALRIGPALAPVVVVEDHAYGYTLTLSAFQVELQVVEAGTDSVFVTAVVDLKADLLLAQDAAGYFTVGLGAPQTQLGLVGHGPELSLLDLTPGLSLEPALEALISTQLEQAVVALPMPTLTVPSFGGLETEVEVTTIDTQTLPSGEQLRASVEVR